MCMAVVLGLWSPACSFAWETELILIFTTFNSRLKPELLIDQAVKALDHIYQNASQKPPFQANNLSH